MKTTTTTKKDEGKNNYKIIAGVTVIGLIALAFGKKTKIETPVEDFDTPTTTATLNNDLILKFGSKGPEVSKLQTYMAIPSDGIFGTQTENTLYKLKGVRLISLKQYLSSPTINQNILKVGTSVMAKLKTGTPIYNAIAKADTSYYSTYEIEKKIPYGQEIGKIRSVNPAGNWYTVYYETLFGFGKAVGFVKSTDIEKI